jgi:hypothetical protein
MQFLSRFGDGFACAAGSLSRDLKYLPSSIQCGFDRRLNL